MVQRLLDKSIVVGGDDVANNFPAYAPNKGKWLNLSK
jgi:hypothetical protein